MHTLTLVVLLAQASSCPPSAAAAMADGDRLASELALSDAAERYARAASGGCQEATIPSLYLVGLLAARDAYRVGGSAESLQPVRAAELALGELADGPGSIAEIARVLLMAAASAAQSERYEMQTLLTHATELEALRLLAGESPVPGVSAHELAGDLWLQVHRFDDARTAYRKAAERVGMTPRVALGLARAAARLGNDSEACQAYASFGPLWTGAPDHAAAEEARSYLSRECR